MLRVFGVNMIQGMHSAVPDAEGIWCQHDPGHAFYRAKSGGIQWQAAIAASAIATSRLCVILLVSRLKGESQTL